MLLFYIHWKKQKFHYYLRRYRRFYCDAQQSWWWLRNHFLVETNHGAHLRLPQRNMEGKFANMQRKITKTCVFNMDLLKILNTFFILSTTLVDPTFWKAKTSLNGTPIVNIILVSNSGHKCEKTHIYFFFSWFFCPQTGIFFAQTLRVCDKC